MFGGAYCVAEGGIIMGWTEVDFQKEKFTSKGLDDFFSGYSDIWKPLLPGSKVGGVYYRPFVSMKDGSSTLIAVVLVKYSTARRSLTYKDMSDSMGPYYYSCPKKILDAAGGVQGAADESQRRWREKCYAMLEKKKLARKVSDGTYLRFKDELSFTSGEKGRYFEFCRKKSRTPYFILFTSIKESGAKYVYFVRIHGWQEMDFEIISEHELNESLKREYTSSFVG